jgi:hypothetical protein
VKKTVVDKLEMTKYFAVILDCTPDVSHQGKIPLVLRYADVSSEEMKA